MTAFPITQAAWARLKARASEHRALRRRARALALIERSVRLDAGALHEVTKKVYARAVDDTVTELKRSGRLT